MVATIEDRKMRKQNRFVPNLTSLAALAMMAVPQYEKYSTFAEKRKGLAWRRSPERKRTPDELMRMERAEQKRKRRAERNLAWLECYRRGNEFEKDYRKFSGGVPINRGTPFFVRPYYVTPL